MKEQAQAPQKAGVLLPEKEAAPAPQDELAPVPQKQVLPARPRELFQEKIIRMAGKSKDLYIIISRRIYELVLP